MCASADAAGAERGRRRVPDRSATATAQPPVWSSPTVGAVVLRGPVLPRAHESVPQQQRLRIASIGSWARRMPSMMRTTAAQRAR